jgi:hypothetical protein
MAHPERIVENETPFETGKRSTYMRYASLEEMLRGQFMGLADQSIEDGEKGRNQNKTLEEEAAIKINEAADIVARLQKISELHTEE